LRALGIAIVTFGVACHLLEYRPLDVAARCRCAPWQYCKVKNEVAECLALPVTCVDQPACECVADLRDACRNDDGRITVFHTRQTRSCAECSSEEYCIESAGTDACRILPRKCETTPTCACFLDAYGRTAQFACDERAGHVVVRMF
jgi:hypothetical protein